MMRSRIKAASVAAVAVLVAATMFHDSRGADATQNEPVVAGQINTELGATSFCWLTGGATCTHENSGLFVRTDLGKLAVLGTSDTASGTGVDGEATNGTGVRGEGFTGVYGKGGDGVYGEGTENGVHAVGGTFGVFAEGTDYGTFSRGPNYGVFGTTTDTSGTGVWGESNTGTGVRAKSTGGTALQVTGKAEFSRSGRAVVAGTSASPKSFVVVSGVALTANSLVLVTPQKAVVGVFVIGAVPNVAGSSVKIVLNTPVTLSYPVAWLLVERP